MGGTALWIPADDVNLVQHIVEGIGATLSPIQNGKILLKGQKEFIDGADPACPVFDLS